VRKLKIIITSHSVITEDSNLQITKLLFVPGTAQLRILLTLLLHAWVRVTIKLSIIYYVILVTSRKNPELEQNDVAGIERGSILRSFSLSENNNGDHGSNKVCSYYNKKFLNTQTHARDFGFLLRCK
jgi:hypothetical protein